MLQCIVKFCKLHQYWEVSRSLLSMRDQYKLLWTIMNTTARILLSDQRNLRIFWCTCGGSGEVLGLEPSLRELSDRLRIDWANCSNKSLMSFLIRRLKERNMRTKSVKSRVVSWVMEPWCRLRIWRRTSVFRVSLKHKTGFIYIVQYLNSMIIIDS